MEMTNKKTSDFFLEKMLHAEISPDRRSELEKDPEVQERLEALKKSDTAILEQYPAHAMTNKILERLENGREGSILIKRRRFSTFVRKIQLVFPVAAVVLILFLVLPLVKQQESVINVHNGGTERLKGAPHIRIYRKRGTQGELLKEGSTIQANDRLQISYLSYNRAHGMIFSVDGRNSITLYFPRKVGGSTLLKAKKEQLLPYSYEVDNAPNYERFIFITSDKPIDTRRMLERVKKAAKNSRLGKTRYLKLSKGVGQFSVFFNKQR